MSSFTSEAVVPVDHQYLRPKECYKRIDDVLLTGDWESLVHNHAIHDTLNGQGRVEVYEIYKHETGGDIFSIIKFGNALNGHPGILHGGITAMLFDNTFGWLFYSLDVKKAFTANLNINYRYLILLRHIDSAKYLSSSMTCSDIRKPILANSTVILRTNLEKHEGRKLFMKATMESPEGELLADSTTLFLTPRIEG